MRVFAGIRTWRGVRRARVVAERARIGHMIAENEARLADLNQPCRLCIELSER